MLRGNQVLSGTWGEVWVDGVPILEAKKVEAKHLPTEKMFKWELMLTQK